MRFPRSRPGVLLRAFVLAGVGFAAARPAAGDQLVTAGETLTGGRITGFVAGMVSFRGEDGQTTEVAIESIERLFVDSRRGFDDFNQAEEAMSRGEFGRSYVPYERSLRAASDGYWPDLITCRLLVAFDRGGRIDRAVQQFIRAARGSDAGPTAAARLLPRTYPVKRDEASVRAVEQLDEAIRGAGDEAMVSLLKVLRYRILVGVADPRGEAERVVVAGMRLPEVIRTRGVYAIQGEALAGLLSGRTSAEDLGLVERVLEECPAVVLPDFLLLKGRTLLARASSREEIIRATWPLMRVAIHMSDDARAAEGLLEASRAMERLGRPEKAIRLLEECVDHKSAVEAVRREAGAALARLKDKAVAG